MSLPCKTRFNGSNDQCLTQQNEQCSFHILELAVDLEGQERESMNKQEIFATKQVLVREFLVVDFWRVLGEFSDVLL